MARFTTETSQMNTTAQHVSQVNSEVASMLASLGAEVATAPTHFKGAAATTFAGLMQDYDAAAKRLNQALAGIAEEIKASGQAYASQDEARSAALRSSGSDLNL